MMRIILTRLAGEGDITYLATAKVEILVASYAGPGARGAGLAAGERVLEREEWVLQ
jgi:hypothetical protein